LTSAVPSGQDRHLIPGGVDDRLPERYTMSMTERLPPVHEPEGSRLGAALRLLVFGTAVLVLLVAGAWMGLKSSRDVVSSDRVRGTMHVTSCKQSTACVGDFTPQKDRHGPKHVRISKIAVGKPGERLLVALRPGTDEVVRTGTGGLAQAWVVMGGALLLSSFILASGLGMRRIPLLGTLVGLLILAGAFLAR
jgi:hypothetical protein